MNAEDEVVTGREYLAEAILENEDRSPQTEEEPLLPKNAPVSTGFWPRKPSLLWLLPPFFFTAVMSGASITPRLSLISNLLCRTYYAKRSVTMPGLEILAVDEIANCNIAEISGQIAKLSTSLNTITGVLAAVTSAKYGLWSDRRGRRYPLMITMIGSLANDLCYILVAKYYKNLTIYFLFIGAMCDGLTGSFMSAMAATYAYTTDVVPPQRRAVAFGYFQCCFYGGIAIGPTLGGYLVKKTNNVLIIFYLAMGVHIVFALYTLFILPESLSAVRQEVANHKHRVAADQENRESSSSTVARTSSKVFAFFNLYKALSVFFPKRARPVIKRNLRLLMAIDVCLLLNFGAFTIIILYGKFMFRWSDLQQGYLLSLIGGTRVLVLLAVLPVIVRFVRGKNTVAPPDHDHDAEHPPEGADLLDLWLIRVSMVLEIIGFVLFASATSSGSYYTAGGVSALAGIGMPTLASVLTKHVPSTQTGHLLGAVALMQSLNRVFAPLLFGLLYAATVSTHPATCFLVLACMMGLGFLLSLALRPSTSNGPDSADEGEED